MEQVVSEHQADWSAIEELSANQEGLSQPIRAGLYGVLNVHPPAGTIAQQLLEGTLVVGSGDDQDLANTRQHQSAEWVIDHRFVINGQQLLANCLSDRVEAAAATPGEDDAASLRIHMPQG